MNIQSKIINYYDKNNDNNIINNKHIHIVRKLLMSCVRKTDVPTKSQFMTKIEAYKTTLIILHFAKHLMKRKKSIRKAVNKNI